MPAGRPSDYSEEKTDAICIRLAMGESLKRICEDADMPSQPTVYAWLLKHEEFLKKYARAREMQSETGVDEILEIADDGTNDWMERKNADGAVIGWQENGEALRRSQLRIDARKWMAGKLRPKVYGDKLTNEHTGADGAALVFSTIYEDTRPKAITMQPAISKSDDD